MSRSTKEATTAMPPRPPPPVAIPRRSPPGDSRCESPRAIAAAPGPNGRPVQNAAPTITAAMPRMRALRLARASSDRTLTRHEPDDEARQHGAVDEDRHGHPDH